LSGSEVQASEPIPLLTFDDRRSGGPAQQRQHGLGHPDQPEDVGLVDSLHILSGEVSGVPMQVAHVGGVVDQDVEVPVTPTELVGRCLHRQIRDVPEDVRPVLTAGAAARGQSLQAYLLGVLTAEARRAGNRSLLTRFDNRVDGTWWSPGHPAVTLDGIRGEREAQLAELPAWSPPP